MKFCSHCQKNVYGYVCGSPDHQRRVRGASRGPPALTRIMAGAHPGAVAVVTMTTMGEVVSLAALGGAFDGRSLRLRLRRSTAHGEAGAITLRARGSLIQKRQGVTKHKDRSRKAPKGNCCALTDGGQNIVL